MKAQKKTQAKTAIDKDRLVENLDELANENGEVATYIGCTLAYGRPLGYVEGKRDAYSEIKDRITGGAFDKSAGGEED